MLTKIQKWGNSLALRIPKAFAAEANITNDSVVEISMEDGQIKIKTVTAFDWTLNQLLAGVTHENIHQEISTGNPVGNETW